MGIINPETRNDADHLQSASFFFFWIGAVSLSYIGYNAQPYQSVILHL